MSSFNRWLSLPAVAGFLILISARAQAVGAAETTVTVGPNPLSSFTVNVGETLTIPIYATVTDPTATPSGIFTYDFDVLTNDSGLQIMFYQLHGDTSLGNQTFITSDANGLHNLNAGFSVPNMGIGTSVELFRITVAGLTSGLSSLSIGDSIVPQGAPIVLYDDVEPQVYSSAIFVQVVAVPEPASIALLFAGLPLLSRRRQIQGWREVTRSTSGGPKCRALRFFKLTPPRGNSA